MISLVYVFSIYEFHNFYNNERKKIPPHRFIDIFPFNDILKVTSSFCFAYSVIATIRTICQKNNRQFHKLIAHSDESENFLLILVDLYYYYLKKEQCSETL